MGSADWGLKSSSRVLLIQNINPISWALRFACIGAREGILVARCCRVFLMWAKDHSHVEIETTN